MNPNKALLEKGDFTRIAKSMRESGEALVQRLGITKGLKVLDLGCGDGTTALPAAKLGADVLGVDIARNLVEAGNKRAREHALANCTFQEGDLSDLHQLPDQAFELVVTVFGAMFAPKPRIRMPSESDAEVQSRLQDSSILEPAFPNHYVRSRNDERQSRELDNRNRILNRPFLLFCQRHPRTALRRGRPLRS